MPMIALTNVMALLEQWVRCGWLRELDRSFALFLCREAGDHSIDPLLLLAAALTSHQLGRGHVCLDLQTTLDDASLALALPPEGGDDEAATIRPAELLAGVTLPQWLSALQHPLLTSSGEGNTPLVCCGHRLYLRRYWRYEQIVRLSIEQRLADSEALRRTLPVRTFRLLMEHLFPDSEMSSNNVVPGETNWQKLACALAAGSAFSIITGGPGTGKTTTVVRLLVLLQALALGSEQRRPLRIRLAAPTGKAAARLSESIAGALARLPLDTLPGGEMIRSHISSEVVTLHRLLGSRPDSRHFYHHAENPLMLDALVVDEASMVDVEMMAALLQAVPSAARLILLGDKDQLASVEAGALLGELCQRAAEGHYWPQTLTWLESVTGEDPDMTLADPDGHRLDQAIVMLRHSYRFGADSGIGRLAQAVNTGNTTVLQQVWQSGYADLSCLTLRADDPSLLQNWVIHGAADTFPEGKHSQLPHKPVGYGHYLQLMKKTRPAQDAPREAFDAWAGSVLHAFGQFQLLCAVRRGAWGVESLNEKIAVLLSESGLLDAWQGWYPGRPVLITRNNYSQRLMNGDIGIALTVPLQRNDGSREWGVRVAFPAGDGSQAVRWILPGRLQAAETVFAMTVHKSQGSEFTHTALLLPDTISPILTRELIYTGITRARDWFSLGSTGGGGGVLPVAIQRRVQRSSGLTASADNQS